MILQALKEYYDRKPDLPRPGFELKEIPFVLTLKPDGTPVSLTPTYEGEGKARRAKQFLIPQAVKRSVNVAANLLWDNPEYVLGVVLKGNAKRVEKQHAAFKQRIEDLGLSCDPGVNAVRAFLAKPNKAELLTDFGASWEELKTTGPNLSFQLAGQPGLIVEQPAVQAAIVATVAGAGGNLCLVTGNKDTTKTTHPAIKGVWGAQSSGANIVSFNQDAFKSFHKEQGANAPVGESAAFAYTTALNHLLGKDSKQRLQVGDASTVFWSEKANPIEEGIPSFFAEPPKDDPDRNVRAVESLYRSVHTGAFSSDDKKTRFYVLGLAPNASRIAVRFWIVDTVANMAGKICQHFADTKIVHGPRDKDALSLFRLLVSTATQGKSENIPPNLGGDMMRAILEGLPYSQTLLQAAIRRVRAEHEINYPRAALIKACLNRATRYQNPEQKEELHVSLDIANPNVGYRLGRLFAALEKIQQEASPGINATIRDRFYGAASSTPVTVFGNLMRLKNHHLAKLESTGRRVQFDKLLGEIMSGIEDFPPHLRLEDQGRFAIGYYHQMQAFFTKKTNTQDKED
jgi:CRISPR-associated protein Csd1